MEGEAGKVEVDELGTTLLLVMAGTLVLANSAEVYPRLFLKTMDLPLPPKVEEFIGPEKNPEPVTVIGGWVDLYFLSTTLMLVDTDFFVSKDFFSSLGVSGIIGVQEVAPKDEAKVMELMWLEALVSIMSWCLLAFSAVPCFLTMVVVLSC